jgi:hypothetical protein
MCANDKAFGGKPVVAKCITATLTILCIGLVVVAVAFTPHGWYSCVADEIDVGPPGLLGLEMSIGLKKMDMFLMKPFGREIFLCATSPAPQSPGQARPECNLENAPLLQSFASGTGKTPYEYAVIERQHYMSANCYKPTPKHVRKKEFCDGDFLDLIGDSPYGPCLKDDYDFGKLLIDGLAEENDDTCRMGHAGVMASIMLGISCALMALAVVMICVPPCRCEQVLLFLAMIFSFLAFLAYVMYFPNKLIQEELGGSEFECNYSFGLFVPILVTIILFCLSLFVVTAFSPWPCGFCPCGGCRKAGVVPEEEEDDDEPPPKYDGADDFDEGNSDEGTYM